jgi:hypothetical protein
MYIIASYNLCSICIHSMEEFNFSQEEGIGPVGSKQTFLPMIKSPAAPSHVYHYKAQTDTTGIEPGPFNGSTNVPTNLGTMTWRPQTKPTQISTQMTYLHLSRY